MEAGENLGCVVCKKAPTKVCQCQGERYCDKHMAKHLKSTGDHKVVGPEEVRVSIVDPSSSLEKKSTDKSRSSHSLERKRTRKLGPSEGPQSPTVRRTLTKTDFIQLLQAELGKVTEFRESTSDAIASLAENLISRIVSESKGLVRDITRICAETESTLYTALLILQGLPADDQTIPMTNPVLVRLYEAREEEGYSMLKFQSEVREITVDFKGLATYSVQWAPVASMVELRQYFDRHKAEMHTNVQSLFETVFAEQHYTTETLSLNKSSLSEHSGVEHLAMVLHYFTNLKEIQLASNSLGVDEARIIFPMLGKMTAITKLQLQKNELKASGGRELAQVLGNFTKLRELNLSGNTLGAEGIRQVASVMKKLTSLKHLYLQENNLGSDSAKHLAGGLRTLKGLKTLRLEGNTFSADDVRSLNNSNASGCKIQFSKGAADHVS